MKKEKATKNTNKRIDLVLSLVGVAAFLSIAFLVSTSYNAGKIYKNIYVAGVDVSGKTPEEARNLIDEKIKNYPGAAFGSKKVKPRDAGVTLGAEQAVGEAYVYGRNKNIFLGFEERISGNWVPKKIELTAVSTSELQKFLLSETDSLNTKAKNSEISWQGGLRYSDGVSGKRLLIVDSKIALLNNFKNLSDDQSLKMEEIDPDIALSKKDLSIIENKVKEPIGLEYEGKSWQIAPQEMANWFILSKETDDLALTSYLWPLVKGTKISSSVNNEAVADYVTRLASQIDVSTQNATLKAENGKVVVAIPAKNGLELDKAEIINQIINALGGKSRKIQLKVNKKLAEVREDNIENLGLKELVSVGTSNFSGSPTNRIHNVTTGAAKFNGAIVKPGEVFSFNTILGPVDASTGFTPELVIKENKTVPEFGGGLCQVSSTAFRAALNAGFPILERANHAYPVTYYYPLGTDATIYLPSPDFKFKNDSAGHILVQTNIVGNILKFEFYGTKKPIRVKFGGQEDALGAVDKVEDVKPNLYDQNWSGEGSVKSLWYRFIYDGEKLVKTDKFNSNYDSPKKYPH